MKVSGHITFETVTSFLSDFHHKDREDVDVEAVFLHPDEPELEFQGFLKKQYPRVRYYQVSSFLELAITRFTVSQGSLLPGKQYPRVCYYQVYSIPGLAITR